MADQTSEPIFTQKLREPLTIGKNETVSELSFRKPTAGDIMRCGNPVKYTPYDENQDIAFDEPKLLKMIATLSGTLQPFVERMDPNDFLECGWALAPFFVPGMRRASATS